MYQNIAIQILSVHSDIEEILPDFTARLYLQEFEEIQLALTTLNRCKHNFKTTEGKQVSST